MTAPSTDIATIRGVGLLDVADLERGRKLPWFGDRLSLTNDGWRVAPGPHSGGEDADDKLREVALGLGERLVCVAIDPAHVDGHKVFLVHVLKGPGDDGLDRDVATAIAQRHLMRERHGNTGKESYGDALRKELGAQTGRHGILHRLIARIKAVFRGRVE